MFSKGSSMIWYGFVKIIFMKWEWNTRTDKKPWVSFQPLVEFPYHLEKPVRYRDKFSNCGKFHIMEQLFYPPSQGCINPCYSQWNHDRKNIQNRFIRTFIHFMAKL